MIFAKMSKADYIYYIAIPVSLWLITVILNWPGHYSLDSMMQLIEGMTGEYVTFNPPLMAQILALLTKIGGHGLFMAFNASIFLASVFMLLFGTQQKGNKIYVSFLLAVLFLNPLTLIYNGIVWKDVLSANISILAICLTPYMKPKHLLLGLISIAMVAISMNIRPQAIVLLPVLALIISLAYFQGSVSKAKKAVLFIFLIIAGIGASKAIAAVVKFNQNGSSVDATQVGLSVAERFDIAGMIFYSKRSDQTLETFFQNSSDIIAAVRKSYTPERVDTLEPFAKAANNFEGINIPKLWVSLALADPLSLAKHKLSVASKLFGFRLHGECLPAHLGVADNSIKIANELGVDYIFPEGFVPKVSAYYFELFKYLSVGLIFFTGWLWLVVNGVLLIATPYIKSKTVFCLSLAGLLYSLVFFLVGVACDFRYQYFSVLCALFSLFDLLINHNQAKSGDKKFEIS